MRGQYAAILQKVNFFEDGNYKQRAKAASSFKAAVLMPRLHADTDPVPMIEAGAAPGAISTFAAAARHEATVRAIMSAARELFEDAREFETAFLTAMQARENAAVAEVCNRLRIKPESFGPLRALSWRERMLAGEGEDRTLALRGQIIAARQALNNERAEAALDAAGVAALPAPAPAPTPVVVDDSAGIPVDVAVGAPSGAASRSEAPKEAATGDVEDPSESDTGVVTKKSGVKARSIQAMLAARRGEIGEEAQAELLDEANLLGGAGDHFVDTPDDLPSLMAE